MHDTIKRVGAASRTDIQYLERVLSEELEDVPLVWEGKNAGNERIRVSVWLGVLSLHIRESGGESEIARINLGRLFEIQERVDRNINRARRAVPNLRPLTRAEENRCWRAAAGDPELRFFESHNLTPAAFGGIWQVLRVLKRLLETRG